MSMKKQKYNLTLMIVVIGCILHFIGDDKAWAYENIVDRGNRRTIEVGLNGVFPTGWHTPQWYQYRQYQANNNEYYPIGCGSTAWTIVYGYWRAFKRATNLSWDRL